MEQDEGHEEKEQKSSAGKAIIVGVVVIILVLLALRFFDYASTPENTDKSPNLLNRLARDSDISVTQSTEFSLSDSYTLIPYTDISNLQVTIKFLDSSKQQIVTKTKVLGNVTQNTAYTFSFQLTEFSLTEILNIKYWTYSVSGGTVSYFS